MQRFVRSPFVEDLKIVAFLAVCVGVLLWADWASGAWQ